MASQGRRMSRVPERFVTNDMQRAQKIRLRPVFPLRMSQSVPLGLIVCMRA
jgi:hypothetical protein